MSVGLRFLGLAVLGLLLAVLAVGGGRAEAQELDSSESGGLGFSGPGHDPFSSETSPRAWRPTMLRVIDIHGKVWGGTAAGFGVLSLGSLTVGAVQGADGDCPMAGCGGVGALYLGLAFASFAVGPSTGVLPTLGVLHRAVRETSLSPERFRVRLLEVGGGLLLAAGGSATVALLLHFAAALSVTFFPYTPSVALGASAVVLLEAAATVLTLAEFSRRWESRQSDRQAASSRPVARIQAVGPTGIVVVF